MPTFDYRGVNKAGEPVSGTVEGDSMEKALAWLSDSGLIVERINQSVLLDEPWAAQPYAPPAPPPVEPIPVAPPIQHVPPASNPYQERSAPGGPTAAAPPTEQRNYFATSVIGPLAGGVSTASMSMFYRQLGTMLEAGVPIVQSLDTLSRQGRNPKMHAVVKEIKGHVEAGREISTGMQRYPEVFPALSLSLVRVGEEGGFLAQSFKLLADYTDKEIALRNLIRRLTLQPKITFFGAIIIICGGSLLMTAVGLNNSMLANPVVTLVAILTVPVLVAGFLFFRVGLANPRIRYNWDQLIIKTPFGVGKTAHEFAMSKFGMALAFLQKGGVPVQRAIPLAADACGNEYVRSQIAPAGRRLESGAGITDTLRGTQAFSPIVLDMIDTGEHTGNLDGMLMRMSTFYEDEAETRAKQVAQIFSVLLFLLVAIFVAFILISFYSKYAAGLSSAGGD